MIHLMSLLTMDVFVLLRDLDSTPTVFTPWSWSAIPDATFIFILIIARFLQQQHEVTPAIINSSRSFKIILNYFERENVFSDLKRSVMCWLLSPENMTLGWRHDSWCLEFHSKSQIWQYWNCSETVSADTFILFNLTILEWQLFSTILAGLGFILKH